MVLPKRKCTNNANANARRKRIRSISSQESGRSLESQYSQILVIDNGAHTIKVGYVDQAEPIMIPNCVMKVKSERRRAFIGNQINECPDLSGLYYQLPFQRGYLVNWDIQKTVWDYVFGEENVFVNFSETPILITEPVNNFRSIHEATKEIFFEEYECQSLLQLTSTDLSEFKYSVEQANLKNLCTLVVDTGFSFTHIVPYAESKKVSEAIRRIDVGGKLLTNQLKEVISYRQLNVMDETHVMNQCKEDCCYVSLNFKKDVETTCSKGNNTIVREYVLPNYSQIKRGYMRELIETNNADLDQQVLRLNNERITIPEVLFHPSDIGIEQKGIVETIMDSVDACPEEMRPHLLKNIILTGGCATFPNFRERVELELYTMRNLIYDINISIAPNPVTYAYEAGTMYSYHPSFPYSFQSKEEYFEVGT